MPIQPLRIGLIVPSSNTVMEPDFHRRLGGIALVSTARIFLTDVTREAEMQMLQEDLPRAVEQLRTTQPDIIVFGCTSAGALGALSHDDAIAEMIEKRGKAQSITVLRAVLDRLESLRPKKIAVFTPYIEDLTHSVARSLTEGGYTVVKAAGMGITANVDIGRVTPEEIGKFVESQLSGIHPDCVFLSCTNWRAIDAIESLKIKLGVPVISSNQAAIDFIQQHANATPMKGAHL